MSIKANEGIKNVIDDFFADVFYFILNIEAKYVSKKFGTKISSTEMHILKAVQDTSIPYCGKVADRLSIKTPSLTVTANKLVDKGYLSREVDENDKRKIKLCLTKKGEEALEVHKEFHDELIKGTIKGMEEEDLAALSKALKNMKKTLNEF